MCQSVAQYLYREFAGGQATNRLDGRRPIALGNSLSAQKSDGLEMKPVL